MFKVEDKWATGHAVYFDVDETLMHWLTNSDPRCEEAILVPSPWDGDSPAEIGLPIESHINALKKHKKRGDQIIIWSQGGSDWCEAVVKALGIEEYVDVVLTKPTIMYDDLRPFQWGYQFIYSPDEEVKLPDERDVID